MRTRAADSAAAETRPLALTECTGSRRKSPAAVMETRKGAEQERGESTTCRKRNERVKREGGGRSLRFPPQQWHPKQATCRTALTARTVSAVAT